MGNRRIKISYAEGKSVVVIEAAAEESVAGGIFVGLYGKALV
jgi:nitrate reductase NapAB chaperone NapD